MWLKAMPRSLGGVVDDDVPGHLISLESLDASHYVALPTRIDYQVDSSSA